MKRVLVLAAASALTAFAGLAVDTATAGPARADCAWGGIGIWSGGYCDTNYWPDGSYYHCLNTPFGGSCGRVCPPPPGSSVPAAYTGHQC